MAEKEMINKDKEILRKRLRERRVYLDMTLEDLAQKSGLSKSTLQRYETTGIQSIPHGKIFVLSEALPR